MKKHFFALLACLVAFSLNVQAKDSGYYQLIEDKTVLNLSESAEKEVKQDRIKAILRIVKEARETTTVQNFINKNMTNAVAFAKRYDDVKVSTGTYRVSQKYNNKLRRNDGWSGSQEIILDSKNKESIFAIVQNLQKSGFAMSNMSYYLSREKAASFRTELINEALKRVQDRAKSIAGQLQAKHYHIGSIDVSNQSNRSPRRRNMMEMSKDVSMMGMTAPVVEKSDEIVNVNIKVAVILDMND